MPKSGETTAQQLRDLVAASDTSGEEPNILLRFVCSGKERKNLNSGISLTQYLGIFPMTLENPFSKERESVHAVQTTFPFKISTAMKIMGVPEVDFQIDTGAT